MTTLLDPTNEAVPVARQLAARAPVLKGTVALLDIAKPRGDVLLDRLQELLEENAPDVEIMRCAKPTFTKPAPEASAASDTAPQGTIFVVEGPG